MTIKKHPVRFGTDRERNRFITVIPTAWRPSLLDLLIPALLAATGMLQEGQLTRLVRNSKKTYKFISDM